MAAGDVTVEILAAPFTEASIITAVEALRVGADDKWLLSAMDHQLIIINIEE
tara:strand:+ start:1268 stop:1423 length:156 start_codon:yes stop_codon:yes gene_type:complete